jgi:hypothetical protein
MFNLFFQCVGITDHGYCRHGNSPSCLSKIFHGNSDFQNSQKLDPLQIPATKNLRPKFVSLSKQIWCKKLIHGGGRIR